MLCYRYEMSTSTSNEIFLLLNLNGNITNYVTYSTSDVKIILSDVGFHNYFKATLMCYLFFHYIFKNILLTSHVKERTFINKTSWFDTVTSERYKILTVEERLKTV